MVLGHGPGRNSLHAGHFMRNSVSHRSGYAIHSRALESSFAFAGPKRLATETDKLHAAAVAEVEGLRLRVRALTTANNNLRRRMQSLEAQQTPKVPK